MKVKAVPAITFYLSLMLTILVLLFGNEPNKSQYILVIATITVFYIAYITNKITSPASLLVISSFVFLGCRPLLSLFANYDYRIADWFIEGYMDDWNSEILKEANKILKNFIRMVLILKNNC